MSAPDSPHDAPNLTCPSSVIGALIACAITLSFFARGDGTLTIDARASELIQGLDRDIFATIAAVGNALGEGRHAAILLVALIGLTTMMSRWHELMFLIVLVSLRGAGTLLKGLFDSPRPTLGVAEVTQAFEGLGFPSGHSLTSSVAAGGVAFLVLRVNDSLAARLALALAWLVCVTLTAFARIWTGAHWLTDTIGGTVIGAAIVLISINLSAVIETKRRERDHSTGVPTP